MSKRNTARRILTERWIAWIRVVALGFALIDVGLVSEDYPRRYETYARIATAALAVGALVFLALAYRTSVPATLGLAALAFDVAVVASFVLIYTFEAGTPIRQLLVLPV